MKDINNQERTTLRIKHSIARDLLQKQIKEGEYLHGIEINAKYKLKEIQSKYSKWTNYNFHLLEKIFSDSKQATEYSRGLGIYIIRDRTLMEEVKAIKEDIFRKVTRLESIENSLNLFELKGENKFFTTKRITIGGIVSILAILTFLFGDNIIFRLAENLPILSRQTKSEIIYSRIEKDSIFKDSMFGDIPFKSFYYEINNVGESQAENISINLNSFIGMDLGYDPNLVIIGNPSSGGLNIESRLFHRQIPLAPKATTWFKLAMFKPAYDSLNDLHNTKNTTTMVPSIFIEYSGGIAKEVPVKEMIEADAEK